MTDLMNTASNPVPTGARVGNFPGYDGQLLRYAIWDSTRTPRRGTICLFQGQGEFIEKYYEVIADIRRRGFAVAAMDWRGQGGSYRPLSDPRKGHISDFSEYDRDLSCFMREIVLPDCPPPYLGLGHSMGGHILLRNAGAPGTWFERMVLSAPMLDLSWKKIGFPKGVARIYAEVACKVGFSRFYVGTGPLDQGVFDTNPLTSDHDRYFRYRGLVDASPQLQIDGPTIGWLRAALRSMAMLNDPAYARRIGVPLMFFIAGRDTVVEPRAIEDFASRLKVGTHVILANSRHEILQESDDIRGRFWAAFDAYMGVAEAA